MADTKEPELSLERFAALVEAYGVDFERFPQRERGPAKALALRSRDAQRLLEAARAFDGLLASARENLPTVELEAVLDRIPEQYTQERTGGRLLPFRSRQQAFLAAAAAVLLGLFSGRFVADSELDAASEPGGPVALAEGAEQTELASLIFADELFADLTTEEGGAE